MGKMDYKNKTDAQLEGLLKQYDPGYPLHDGALGELHRRRSIVESENKLLRNKEIDIAASAKNAAWVANAVAILSLIVSGIALYFSLTK